MANELNIALAKSGLTVTAQPYQSGAAVGSAVSCPETGSTGFYSGNMAGSAGTYQLAFRAAGANVGSGSIVWDGTAEVTSSAPTVAQIRAEMDSNSTKLANLDATVSSRLATSGYTAPTSAPSVADIRTELAVELGRLDASVSSRLAPSGTLATVTNLTNAPASVTPSDIWSHAARTLTSASGPTAVEIRQEIDANSTKLDAAISTRMAASEATKLDAVKAKTDALNTERLGNVATTNIVGTLLAQANS